MQTSPVVEEILQLPLLAGWPQAADLLQRAGSGPRPDWDLPAVACVAVGGEVALANPGRAAIACLQLSIILVDDLLDDDPRGEYRRIGAGAAANLALALEASAHQFVRDAAMPRERQLLILDRLSQMALQTAYGQSLDSQPAAATEATYWAVVAAKSTPFYGTALCVGALLGGGTPQVADQMYALGTLLGEIVQVHDDLTDAFQTPAGPDWLQARLNLALLYARLADYPARARFLAIQSEVSRPERLSEAQRLLIQSGAVSYCLYHLIQRYRQATHLLGALALPNPEPVRQLLVRQMAPIVALLQRHNIPLPAELAAKDLLW